MTPCAQAVQVATKELILKPACRDARSGEVCLEGQSSEDFLSQDPDMRQGPIFCVCGCSIVNWRAALREEQLVIFELQLLGATLPMEDFLFNGVFLHFPAHDLPLLSSGYTTNVHFKPLNAIF